MVNMRSRNANGRARGAAIGFLSYFDCFTMDTVNRQFLEKSFVDDKGVTKYFHGRGLDSTCGAAEYGLRRLRCGYRCRIASVPGPQMRGTGGTRTEKHASGAEAPFFQRPCLPGINPRPTSEAKSNAHPAGQDARWDYLKGQFLENARMSNQTTSSPRFHSIKNRSSPLSTWPGKVP